MTQEDKDWLLSRLKRLRNKEETSTEDIINFLEELLDEL